MTGVTSGVEITTLADIPSAGSGLGSSSAVTVGLLHALFAYRGRQVIGRGAGRAGLHDRDRALREAHRQAGPVHRRARRHPRHPVRARRRGGGRGARAVRGRAPGPAAADHAVLHRHHPERGLDPGRAEREHRGHPCRSSTCCATWPASPSNGCAAAMWTRSGPRCARAGRPSGSWPSGVSNDQIDAAVDRALDAGASGAKLTGAGGGGFLLVICPMERQRAVRESLADMRELPVKLDRLGSRIVLNVHARHLGLIGHDGGERGPARVPAISTIAASSSNRGAGLPARFRSIRDL